MSLLKAGVYANANTPLFALAGSGGGGGGSTLQSPASILPASAGTCSLLVQSADSTPATLTVSTAGGGADSGVAAINLTGGTSSTLTVQCDGVGSAIVNVEGGTAANATVNIASLGTNNAVLSMGLAATSATISCAPNGNLSFTPDSGVTALTVVNSPPSLLATGLKLQDAGGQQGAITGQNYIKNALGLGVPTSQTNYALVSPPAANVGWWCYSVGTTEATVLNCSQSCVSTMAYWNGTTFTFGGNVAQPLGGVGGWTNNQFAQLFLSTDRTAINFFFNDGTTVGTLAAMYYSATQMTGAQPGF